MVAKAAPDQTELVDPYLADGLVVRSALVLVASEIHEIL